MKKSTVTMLAAAGLLAVGVGYLAYFDYKRRNDPNFRKKLKKDYRKAKKLAQEASAKTSITIGERALQLVESLQNEKLPTDPAEKEAFFMSKVSAGEALSMKGPSEYDNAAKNFYQALKIYPNPIELIMIYQKTVPETIFAIVMSMMTQEVNLKKKRYFNSFPPKSMNVKALPIKDANGDEIKPAPKAKTSPADAKTDELDAEEPEPKRGLFATKSFKKGDIIYTETPVVSCLLLDCVDKKHCGHCLRTVPAAAEETVKLSASESISNIPTIPDESSLENESNNSAESEVNKSSSSETNQEQSDDISLISTEIIESSEANGKTEEVIETVVQEPLNGEDVLSNSEVIVEKLDESAKLEDFEYNSRAESEEDSQEKVAELLAAEEAAEVLEAVVEASEVANEIEQAAELVAAEEVAEILEAVVKASEATNELEQVAELVAAEEAAEILEAVVEASEAVSEFEQAVEKEIVEEVAAEVAAAVVAEVASEVAAETIDVLSPSFCSESCKLDSEATDQKYFKDPKSKVESDKLMELVKETKSVLPILITRLFGSIVEIEKRKEMAIQLGIPTPFSKVSYLAEDEGASDFTVWEHLERLGADEAEATETDKVAAGLIDKILGVNIEGLASFVNEDRYMMLKRKFVFNNYFIGPSEDKEAASPPYGNDKFRLAKNQTGSVGTGLFMVSSYIQKSSEPNVEIRFVDGTDKMTLFAISDINEGDALLADY
ncbi:Mitochondrial import receptor subunit tom20 [Smittium mucronatum]|uniref:Mitochondrial import receptor subunit tom20 n=1 Tax=Smittium mucronatum TaxID=133383 RepID=A0A1R0H7Z3_9FUNG|nr:Mitochondrial import receptor subunit tom20 [Smittium mucronatum]